MIIADRSGDEWITYWCGLPDEELLDERAEVFTAAEVAEPGGELDRFVRMAALFIHTILGLRRVAREDFPGIDARAFATSVIGEIRYGHMIGRKAEVDATVEQSYSIAEAVAKGQKG
jgi:hypothetical protein